ncbi:MAG: class GN sortase [Halioglobus sp.]|nr:class GN sortase [Halioglobus sp.]
MSSVSVSHILRLGAALCLLFGLQQLGGAALIKAKAALAPVLIDDAWERVLAAGGGVHRPWPWADTWPVARLRFPAEGVELPVLHGDGGNSLAFAPGRALASAPFGTEGVSVIGGHRDTHFAFLEHVTRGDTVELQLRSGEWRRYRVREVRIADAARETLSGSDTHEELMLVTCYPFDALAAGGPLRYVVSARPLASSARIFEI